MKNYVYRIFSLLFFLISILNISYSQDYKILKSDDTQLILEFNFYAGFEVKDINIDGIKFTNINDSQIPLRNPGDPFLPLRFYEVGIPLNKKAIVSIQEIERQVYTDKFVISTPDSADQPLNKLNYNEEVYGTNSLFPIEAAEVNSEAIFRYIKTISLSISPIPMILIIDINILQEFQLKLPITLKTLSSITPSLTLPIILENNSTMNRNILESITLMIAHGSMDLSLTIP